jgi:hypothetical protein
MQEREFRLRVSRCPRPPGRLLLNADPPLFCWSIGFHQSMLRQRVRARRLLYAQALGDRACKGIQAHGERLLRRAFELRRNARLTRTGPGSCPLPRAGSCEKLSEGIELACSAICFQLSSLHRRRGGTLYVDRRCCVDDVSLRRRYSTVGKNNIEGYASLIQASRPRTVAFGSARRPHFPPTGGLPDYLLGDIEGRTTIEAAARTSRPNHLPSRTFVHGNYRNGRRLETRPRTRRMEEKETRCLSSPATGNPF